MNHLSLIAISVYLGAATAQGLHLAGKLVLKKSNLLIFCLLAICLHGFLLYRWIDTGEGQNLSLGNMFSFVSWLMTVIIVLAAIRKPIESLMVLVFPIASLSIGCVLLFPSDVIFQTKSSPASIAHIFLSLTAISVLAMAGLHAVLLAIQNYLLKQPAFGAWLKFLPPLETMETLLFQIIWAGFILLSLTLVGAIVYLQDLTSTGTQLSKLLLSLLAWILFAILLYGRYKSGWRGKMAVQWTLCSVSLLFLAYFGTKFWMEQL